jgi:hypothetical protein
MKELEKEFRGAGEVSNFTFKQIAFSIRGYVYELTDENNNRHYETFERKEQQKRESTIAGIRVSFDEKVLYPTSNSFGVSAWCFRSEESAMNCFNELKNL